MRPRREPDRRLPRLQGVPSAAGGQGPPGPNRQRVFGLGLLGIDERAGRLRRLEGRASSPSPCRSRARRPALGITANALAPGLMMTEMMAEKYGPPRKDTSRAFPLGRFAELEEVAAAAGLLCLRQAAYITGTVVNVSGGLLMR